MVSYSARIAAAAIALIAWLGLAVQLEASSETMGGPGIALWAMARFFTILTNLMVALLFTGAAMGWRWAWKPFLLGGITLMILLVGIVYMLLLRGLLSLSGGALLADMLLHKVTPVLVALWWIAFAPKGGLDYRDAGRWALLPLAYFGYALARGASDGKYPYPFMDVGRLGWPPVLLNAALIALAFLIAGAGLVWLGRRMEGSGD